MMAAIILASFALSALVVFALNWLALRPWRRSVGQHWAERARILYLAAKSNRFNFVGVPFILGLSGVLFLPFGSFLYIAIPGLVGARLGSYFFTHEIRPDIDFKHWLHVIGATELIGLVFWVPIGLCVYFMPNEWGWKCVIPALIFLAVFTCRQMGQAMRLRKLLKLIRPAPVHLQDLVAEVSAKMMVPARAVWVWDALVANAWAHIATKELVFSEKLLASCPDDEIQAICTHELGHLSEPGGAWWRIALADLTMLPLVFINPAINSNGVNGLLAIGLIMVSVAVLQTRLRRKMEVRADQIGANSFSDPATYARALARLYEINQAPAVISLRAKKVHPNLYDRMTAVGVTPDFPRPAPPEKRSWHTRMMAFLVIFLAIFDYLKFKQ